MVCEPQKFLLVGIDSMDPLVVSKHINNLPNLHRIMTQGHSGLIKSVFPPDSIPAWVTIYTGLDPSHHGLVYTPDVFQSNWDQIMRLDTSAFRGRTFWDLASNSGERVFVWFPLAAFPPWEVNGVMISRSFDGKVESNPKQVADDYGLKELGHLSGVHPGRRNLDEFIHRAKKLAIEETRRSVEVAQQFPWSMGFFYSSALDIIQHFFWRYYDQNDPTFRNVPSFAEAIPEFYKLMDDWIGLLTNAFPEAKITVISDHGHGMRPPKTVNVNELLRRKEILEVRGRKPYIMSRSREFVKRALLEVVYALEQDDMMLSLAKKKSLASTSRGMYLSKKTIDTERSGAFLSTFAGPKSYPTGGITVNLTLDEDSQTEIRERVLEALNELRDPSTSKKIVKWACSREDIFRGPHASMYPDILFQLEENYGVYWGVLCPLIGRAYEHHLASGGHKEIGFIATNWKAENLPTNISEIAQFVQENVASGIVNGQSQRVEQRN